jgi:hypothetical protein
VGIFPTQIAAPYYIGGEIREKSALTLQTRKAPRSFSHSVRVKNEALKINPEKKTVYGEKA